MQNPNTLSDKRQMHSAPLEIVERRMWGTTHMRYGDALCGALIDGPVSRAPFLTRGGLSGWRKKMAAEFIEEHLTERIRLATLAGLVELSPFHFARAFKQSFGVPPLRYHSSRRIERAKAMLAERSSVTEIAVALGFADTSSFSTAFRKATGASPSNYRSRLR